MLFRAGWHSLLQEKQILFYVSFSVTQYNNNTDYCFIPPPRSRVLPHIMLGVSVGILKTVLSLAEAWWLGSGSRQ